MSTKTIDLNRFKDAVGFTATFCKWGNRRRGNVSQLKTCDTSTVEGAAQDQKTKSRLKVTKELIKSEELEKINSFLGELRRWVYINTVPSFFKEGFQLTGIKGVEPIEKRMRAAQGELAVLVDALIKAYPVKVDEARAFLAEQFNEQDYPGQDDLKRMFRIQWNWVSFTVPEGLPEELKQAEKDKLEKQFADAGEQILTALRTGFKELVSHAVERLTVPEGDKPKVFKDSMLGNIQEFLDTFNQRNLMGDVELAQLVARAREVMQGMTPQKLRQYAQNKDTVRTAFAEINQTLEKMIEERPSRSIDLTEE